MPNWPNCHRKAASLDSANAYRSCIRRHGIIASKDLCKCQCRGECRVYRVSILRLPNITNLRMVYLYRTIFHSSPSNIIKPFQTHLDADGRRAGSSFGSKRKAKRQKNAHANHLCNVAVPDGCPPTAPTVAGSWFQAIMKITMSQSGSSLQVWMEQYRTYSLQP